MTLVIDAGNTRLKWGIAQPHGWSSLGSVDNDKIGALRITQWKKLPRPSRIVGTNVTGESGRSRIEAQVAHWHVRPEWIQASAEACGVKNNYHVPHTLGADRWAAVIAARQRLLQISSAPPPCLVITAGTTMTISALSSDGVFLGGAIIPGVMSMRSILAATTSALTLHLNVGHYAEFPQSTADAIFSGATDAILGAIRSWRARLAVKEQIAEREVRMILTGGDAAALQPYLSEAAIVAEHLVLEGIMAIVLEQTQDGVQSDLFASSSNPYIGSV
jgi:pantothenate kinase, type III